MKKVGQLRFLNAIGLNDLRVLEEGDKSHS